MSYSYEYPRPAVTVDTLIFNFDPKTGFEILLIQRAHEPFKNDWAIPGGFVDMDEDLLPAAKRELQEETRMNIQNLRELGVFGKPGRDPRGRTITIAYWALTAKEDHQLKAADDAKAYRWFPLDELPNLAFDHDYIINKGIQKLQESAEEAKFLEQLFSTNIDQQLAAKFIKQLFQFIDLRDEFQKLIDERDLDDKSWLNQFFKKYL